MDVTCQPWIVGTYLSVISPVRSQEMNDIRLLNKLLWEQPTM